jgi:hypothetical protein
LKLKSHKLLSTFAFNFNLRQHNEAEAVAAGGEAVAHLYPSPPTPALRVLLSAVPRHATQPTPATVLRGDDDSGDAQKLATPPSSLSPDGEDAGLGGDSDASGVNAGNIAAIRVILNGVLEAYLARNPTVGRCRLTLSNPFLKRQELST